VTRSSFHSPPTNDMPAVAVLPCVCLLATAEGVRHRIGSRLLESFSQWWQMPALILTGLAIAAFVIWTYRRDAADLPWSVRATLATLRLGAFASLGVAALDFERSSEREIVQPSRVAVLVDSSASMMLTDDGAGGPQSASAAGRTRFEQARSLLDESGVLDGLATRHEISIWRFDGDAERIVVLPPVTRSDESDRAAAGEGTDGSGPRESWSIPPPGGAETRLGDALGKVLAEEPAATLAGIVVVSDGGNNAGVDPVSVAARAATEDIAVHPVGVGSEFLPPNVRIADVVAPARVFPNDGFAVTAYLQAQELAGRTVRVELGEAAEETTGGTATRAIDAVDVLLGGDGELTPVRFDVPGLRQPGRRALVVRVVPPDGDRRPADDTQSVDIEVVDRVTHVLLMTGGPGREYQFMRNVLGRDPAFAVDVLLGTATSGISQDARAILPAFPASDDSLAEYDAVVAIDFDWRQLDQAARSRLERWVARDAGGLVMMAGGVFMDSWLSDPRMNAVRSLMPVELRRPNQLGDSSPAQAERPRSLHFSRDGAEAEFLWLAPGRAASDAIWGGFPGVFACFRAGPPKPGATVFARVDSVGAGEPLPYIVGQLYGAGTVLFCGSSELWRLRAVEGGAHERLVTQLVRHVAQGRLLRGARQGRLLVDRERYPVGASVVIRVVLPEGTPSMASLSPVCIARGPSGETVTIPLAAEPGRSDVLRGSLVMTTEGAWQLEVAVPGSTEPLSRRIHGTLPDRELARPRLDRGLLEQCAAAGGGQARFLCDGTWTPEATAALLAALPDRSRRDYEAGPTDVLFKKRLNTALLAAGVGLLCLEWIGRRLSRLA
jgi:hypothetical protein